MSSNIEFANQAPGESGYRYDHPCAAHPVIMDREQALVETVPARKKFALCGFATSTRHHIPVNDPDWECWALNQLYRHIPRIDRQFDVHANWRDGNVEGTDHAAWLAACGIPVYMQQVEPEIQTSIAYPTARLLAKHGLDYLTSTVAYMVVLAIDEIDRAVTRRINGSTPDESAAWRMTATAWSPGDPVPAATVADTLALIRSLYAEYTIGIFGIDLIVGAEYCVAPETKVLTSDLRWVEAWTLQAGDTLVGFDEFNKPALGGRCWRRADVLGMTPLERPCYRITLGNGDVLISSAEHRWLTKSGNKYQWRETSTLASPAHRHPSRLVRVAKTWGVPVHSWDAGYLAAALDGEGHLANAKSRASYGPIGFSQRDNAMRLAVGQALQLYGFEYSRRVQGTVNDSKFEKWSVRGGLAETIRLLGQMRPKRLLELFEISQAGRMQSLDAPAVRSIEFIGDRPVIGLKTSTATFVANGYASHNSTQKPCVEYWLGVAEGRGITVAIPPECALLKQAFRYGRQSDAGSLLKLSEVTARHAALVQETQQTEARLRTLHGAVQESQMMRDVLDLRAKGGTIPLPMPDGSPAR